MPCIRVCFQVTTSVDISHLFLDVDRKWKPQEDRVSLSVDEWRKLVKALDYIDTNIDLEQIILETLDNVLLATIDDWIQSEIWGVENFRHQQKNFTESTASAQQQTMEY